MKKIISLTLLFSMMFSLMVPSVSFAANDKDAVVTKMAPIYAKLTTAEKATMKTAYDAAKDSNTDYLMAAFALLPMSSTGVYDAYYAKDSSMPGYVIEEAIIQFVRSLAMIKHAYDETTLTDAMTYFETISSTPESPVPAGYSVMDVLFENISSAELISLFLNTYSNIGDYVTATDAAALSSASTTDAFLLASKSVVTAAYDGEAAALGLDTLLKSYGWNSDTISDLDDEIRIAIDDASGSNGTKADIALVNALVRTNATLVGSTSITRGSSRSYTFSLFGQDPTNLVKLSSQSSIISISGTTITGVSTGTANIYVHRSGITSPTPGEDYLLSFTVSVSSGSTGSSGGTTTTTPTTDTNEDVANDSADVATESSNVQNEADATEVVEKVTTAATTLKTTIANATTDEEKEEAVKAVTSLATAIINSAKVVTSTEAAKTVLASASVLLDSTKDVAKSATTGTQMKSVVADTANLMNTVKTVLKKLTDSAEATSIAKSVIASTSEVIKTAKATTVTTGADKAEVTKTANKIQQEVTDVATQAIKLAGTATVATDKVTVDATTGKSTATVSSTDIADKIAAAAATKADLQQSMTDAGIDASKELKTQIVISIPTSSDGGDVETKFTGLKDVFDQVDEVEFASSTASFNVKKNSIPGLGNEEVSISAGKVTRTNLTPAQDASLPSSATPLSFRLFTGTTDIHTFDAPISMSLPLSGTFEHTPVLYRLLDTGIVEAVPTNSYGAFSDEGDGTFKVNMLQFSVYYMADAYVTFDDLTDAEWAREAVEYLAANGITSGTSETTFSPNSQITRAEFLTMLMKLKQMSGDTSMIPFEDVSAEDWYASSVAAAYENGYVSGTSATTFSPNAAITRQDMAVMIAKVMLADGYAKGNAADATTFDDAATIQNYALSSVALVSREGVVNGTPDGTFNPDANATRAEAAAMLYNLFILE